MTSTRSSSNTSRAAGGRAAQQPIGVDERQVADEDGGAVAEAVGHRRASPGAAWRRGELDVDGTDTPWRRADPSMMSSWMSANVCSSSSAAPASMIRWIVRVTAGADEAPVAEGGPEPLAAAATRARSAANGSARSASTARPPLLLGGEQGVDAGGDPLRRCAARDGGGAAGTPPGYARPTASRPAPARATLPEPAATERPADPCPPA